MPRNKKQILKTGNDLCEPCNLLRLSLEEVKAKGYKELIKPKEIKKGQLIMLTKDGSLWAVVDYPLFLRKNVSKAALDNLVIYG